MTFVLAVHSASNGSCGSINLSQGKREIAMKYLTEIVWGPRWGILFFFSSLRVAQKPLPKCYEPLKMIFLKVETWFLLLIHRPWHPLPGNLCNALAKRSRSKFSSVLTDRRMRNVDIRQFTWWVNCVTYTLTSSAKTWDQLEPAIKSLEPAFLTVYATFECFRCGAVE